MTMPKQPASPRPGDTTAGLAVRNAALGDAALGHTGNSGFVWLWLAALTLILDQLSKWVIMASITPYQDVIPLTSFFSLVHVHNTGAAFSLFADQPGWQRGFFITLALIAVGFMLHLIRRHPGQPLFNAALALIMGGAIGNVIDRILYGHVIDFLDFYIGNWHWPAFNVADSGISLGALFLIWDSLRRRKAD